MTHGVKLKDCKKTIHPAILFISFILLAIYLITPASAEINWEVSPENPRIGDTLIIRGNASPEERVPAEVFFEKEVPVSRNKYQLVIEEVYIPEGEDNLFTVKAEGVNNLNVRAKKFITVTLSKDATNGIATISQGHVPHWIYKVTIDGTAQSEKTAVDIKVTAFQKIVAESDGSFKFEYETSSMPAGDFYIKIGGIQKTITLQNEDETSSDSGSITGSTPEIIHEQIPEPTLTPDITSAKPVSEIDENRTVSEESPQESSDEEGIVFEVRKTETNSSKDNEVEEKNNNTSPVPEPARTPAIGALGVVLMLIIIFYSGIKRN